MWDQQSIILNDKMYDEIIKSPSKSHETIPLRSKQEKGYTAYGIVSVEFVTKLFTQTQDCCSSKVIEDLLLLILQFFFLL
jgi:hypothetical protein